MPSISEDRGGQRHALTRLQREKNRRLPHPLAAGAPPHLLLSAAERGLSILNSTGRTVPGVLETREHCAREPARVGRAAGGRGACSRGGPQLLAARACAEPGIRPFTYRWNREAPFPGRGRFSRTRGDGRRARTEALGGSANGEPLPEAAADWRLKRRLWHAASPVATPDSPRR